MLMLKELNKASVFDYVEGQHLNVFPNLLQMYLAELTKQSCANG